MFYFKSFNHNETSASDGILQSPLGDNATEPTLGPSGMTERFHWLAKNLFMNNLSHFLIIISEYFVLKAFLAINKIFDGQNRFNSFRSLTDVDKGFFRSIENYLLLE